MQTEWDYTDLADAYLKRPSYSDSALESLFAMAGLSPSADVCDIGAGVGHLTIPLAKRGFSVTAVEPNDAMRKNGIMQTSEFSSVRWVEGTGEKTGQADNAFDLVTFGSSFNVCDRALALKESHRILKAGGFFACMWNHRDLNDPVQRQIESIIKEYISDYDYGSRREDQTTVIEASNLFQAVRQIEGKVDHFQKVEDCIEAWRSHGTLHRQAKEHFSLVIKDIETMLLGLGKGSIVIPYVTKIWFAEKRH